MAINQPCRAWLCNVGVRRTTFQYALHVVTNFTRAFKSLLISVVRADWSDLAIESERLQYKPAGESSPGGLRL